MKTFLGGEMATADPFEQFKATQREAWAAFAPVEINTIIPAARLVRFAQVAAGQKVLDVACGTGVVAVTAARRGASVSGLDLSPALLERARDNAKTAAVAIDFTEGDIEALPYPDAAFDVVLSQFGHIFAPRPTIAVKEMLRVLKVGGRIAFSTWPPEHFTGRLFALIAAYAAPSTVGAERPAQPGPWGDPNIVRERLGAQVRDLRFERDTLSAPSLSPQHTRERQERTVGPLMTLIKQLKDDAGKLAQLRGDLEALIGEAFADNAVHQHFLLSRATKA
jgi:SAM-dependent methyltransferase